jgi:hypothetical protein
MQSTVDALRAQVKEAERARGEAVGAAEARGEQRRRDTEERCDRATLLLQVPPPAPAPAHPTPDQPLPASSMLFTPHHSRPAPRPTPPVSARLARHWVGAG